MPTFYMDYVLGNDATTATPLGWWSIAFTNGNGTTPVAEEIMNGLTSLAHAHVTAITTSTGAWGYGTAAGTLYFYGKSGTFQAETCSFSIGAATCSIGSDLTYCAWKTITTGATAARIAAGDIIRIAKSPDPTSMGQLAKWTTTTTVGGGMPIAQSITGLYSGAGGAIRIVTAAQDWSTGDVIQVLAVTGAVEANGNWIATVIDTTHVDLQGSTYVNAWISGGTAQKINSRAIVLTTAVTQNVCDCDSNWTVGAQTTSANVDTTVLKEGRASVKIITAATCNANQILAKFGLPVALDLNAGNYQQISFWIRNETVALTTGDLEVRLYGEAGCTTLRDKFSVFSISTNGDWIPVTIDLGANIGSGSVAGGGVAGTIQGIAVYTTVQFDAKTVYVDNFVACKASAQPDSLTLQSLVSKNTLQQGNVSSVGYGNEGWYVIQSITGHGITNSGRIILVDFVLGYSGTTESVALYKRETIKTTANGTMVVQNSGSAGNYIQFQGGYDNITNLQSSETFFDGLGRVLGEYGISCRNKKFILLNYMCCYRYAYGIVMDGISSASDNIIVTMTNLSFNTVNGIYIDCNNAHIMTVVNIIGNKYGITFYGGSNVVVDLIVNANSNYTCALSFSTGSMIKEIVNCSNNLTACLLSCNNGKIIKITNCNYNKTGVIFTLSKNSISLISNLNYNTTGVNFTADGNKLLSVTATGNTTNISNTYYNNYVNNFYIANGIEFAGAVSLYNSKVYSNNHDGVAGYSYVYTDNGVVVTDTTVVREIPATGVSWKFSPTNVLRSSTYPLDLVIAKIACDANSLVTVSAWMSRSSQTDISGSLVCKGGQLNGIGTFDINGRTDVSSSLTCFARNTSIVNVPRANPTVFYQGNHGLHTGDEVVFSGIVQTGWLALNGHSYTVTKLTDHAFSIAFDSTGFSADHQCVRTAYRSTTTWFYYPSHGLITGSLMTFSGIVQAGWTALNGNTYIVTVIDANSFSINFDSSAFADDYVYQIPAYMSPWQKLTITFTPTQAGVVEIEGLAWWVANIADENVWIDSLEISQV